MTPNPLRHQLETLLFSKNPQLLLEALTSTWLNEIVPDIRNLIGCYQGSVNHREGDAAIHTSLVYENIIKSSNQRLNKDPDFIELFAAILHDCRKPQTSCLHSNGDISFPNHELLAANEIPKIATLLELTQDEFQKLLFMVANHGVVHSWDKLNEETKRYLKNNSFFPSLALLQEADAKSFILASGQHFTVFYEDMLK